MNKTRRPPKSYKNEEFLSSPAARTVRILSEYLDPAAKFERNNITGTIAFFGSARIKPKETVLAEIADFKKNANAGEDELRQLHRELESSRYYEEAVELAKLTGEYLLEKTTESSGFAVITGGGPGIMEAANKGATLAGCKSVGLTISLPKEESMNDYVIDELGFEFHYFFMRKFWFAYLAKAFFIFPGGFGTLDEMFEILTLVQTKKMTKDLKIILYGTDFWEDLINFDKLVDLGTISPGDVNLFELHDSPESAFTALRDHFEKVVFNKNG
ncbi:MAG: TIGR00730 family Rossman fold protein [Ignavibacteriales bacterium]|nr:MAG: TIGR00730 family Rossman fold protein [Ignavibacteriaceae bacterium]MBW7874089.1 TIGR00730 family Rossman fold protein [Ignavibacteria bacterium]MCZ2143189.1 TIGR00730 family Rossman fold protein [Ignavibacteriales bacterium]OQY71724.1 MAG: Rossman fold protein, TIGR00730 family [Ignavibacteriales bacterium UTCHB3]MBV6444069.1 hypothetical protein [Ignavibacteriaceae bacterium]